MRTKSLALVTCLIACASSAADAQWKPGVMVGTGFQNPISTEVDIGLHMFAAIHLGRPHALYPRFDVLLEQTRTRNILTFANLVYAPLKRRVAPYAVAGAGAYFDNGTPFVGALGVGLDLSTAWRAPLSIEGRFVSAPDPHLLLTLAVRP
jgi:hypothetical protein